MQEAIGKIELRNLQIEDYKQLKASMMEAYSELENSYWEVHHIEKLLKIFPEGQLVLIVDAQVVGSALSLIIDYRKVIANHTYRQITGNFTFDTHSDEGEVLYGIDVFIHPKYRGLRLGRRLYEARKELC